MIRSLLSRKQFLGTARQSSNDLSKPGLPPIFNSSNILEVGPQYICPLGEEIWKSLAAKPFSGSIRFKALVKGPLEFNRTGAIVRLKIFNENGNEIIHKPKNWSRSKNAGVYTYIDKIQDNSLFSVTLKTPEDKVYIFCCFQQWKKENQDPFSIDVVEFQQSNKDYIAKYKSEFLSGNLEKTITLDLTEPVRNFVYSSNRPLFPKHPFIEEISEAYIKRTKSSKLARALGNRWLKAGRSRDVARLAPLAMSSRLSLEAERLNLLEYARTQLHTPHVPPRIARKGILYLLHNCRPYHTGGYASRAHGLLKGFADNGWNIQAVARLGYPWDRINDVSDVPTRTEEDGIAYTFLENNGSIDQADQIGYIKTYAASVIKAINHDEVGLVVAPSFYVNGFAGRLIASHIQVPLVYEMRGLHWFTTGSRKPWWQGSDQGQLMRDLELEAAKMADCVFTITESLGCWLKELGVNTPVYPLPNGCSEIDLNGTSDAGNIRKGLNIPTDAYVVGYIGSLAYYEGIERTMRAVCEARGRSGQNIHFLVVGDGPYSGEIRKTYASLGAPEFIHIVGRISTDEIPAIYASVDLICLAREDLEVCHMISPLKPLEAMLMSKPIIASDVLAIKEIMRASGSGILFRASDDESIVDAILEVFQSFDKHKAMANRARQWVLNNRTWAYLASTATDAVKKQFGLVCR